jgi:hypothetical protein
MFTDINRQIAYIPLGEYEDRLEKKEKFLLLSLDSIFKGKKNST